MCGGGALRSATNSFDLLEHSNRFRKLSTKGFTRVTHIFLPLAVRSAQTPAHESEVLANLPKPHDPRTIRTLGFPCARGIDLKEVFL
jgi:hypothetical protein